LVFFNNDPVPEKYSIHDINAEIAKVLNEYARENNLLDARESDISENEISIGLSTILSTKSGLRLRMFDKEYLGNMIKDTVQERLRNYLKLNDADARFLIQSLKK
jgi:DNA gyrase/topoisomerase IV subunit B